MSLSSPFIHRPVATTLLTIAIALAGAISFKFLPVSPLPQVDYPSISVNANLPGASPETMASAVATPLERQFGRIAGVNEMTSSSQLGSSSITLVFDLNRNIDAAARDVQAAINAARGQLPTNLPSNPSYRKVNPADAPILIFAITSDHHSKGEMYDAASSILAQKLSQVPGVGQVFVWGSSLPSVRVEVNPTALNNEGLGLEDVRATLAAANANTPKGDLSDPNRSYSLGTTDQLLKASQYRPLIVAFKNGAPVRVSDIAQVDDSVEDIRGMGIANGKSSVLVAIFRQPAANIIDTADQVLSLQPQFSAEIPADMHLSVVMDRTSTIRASVRDTEFTLLLSISLVVMVVFLFLRDWRSTIIPSVAVPVSLIGTFGVMYLIGYSIDNLSLMALTIATGFVVDDAIVVVENITRHLELGAQPMQAALDGAKEIGFTVMSISISLIAVFIPILLMGDYMGRLFREFAVTLSVAIAVSLVVSLTTTPMLCALFLKSKEQQHHGKLFAAGERVFDAIIHFYEITLAWVLRHSFIMILVTFATLIVTVVLYIKIPHGFFPQQDTGRISGSIQADQDTSFQAMSKIVQQFCDIVQQDPDVSQVIAFCGGNRTTNTGSMFVTLNPIGPRKLSADLIIARLRPKLARIPGATLNMVPVQDIRIGGRQSQGQYQYTLQGDNNKEVAAWAPKLQDKMKTLDGVLDVSSDQQNAGLEATLDIDRSTAARLGATPSEIDTLLYDAFGQRQVSTMYTPLNQYHVVMELQPKFWQDPTGLRFLYIPGTNGTQFPLQTITTYSPGNAPLAINHQGQFPAITLSFNLKPGFSLGNAVTEIERAQTEIGMPATIHGSFQGTAQAFQKALANEPLLIATAIVAVYIVLGMLYESLIHPITILSTLPSAGVGALLALLLCGMELNIMGLIGIILLIGIVKKNAIMMIDFAIAAERNENKSPRDAIFQACLLRFRPITMTTMAALLGGLPLALGSSTGSELRRPLGVAIVGGLIFSQLLTLYTTPVIYLYLDRFRLLFAREPKHPVLEAAPA
jgi:hydrophobe/amphiphile efflux-1 (HAE1) family protein